MIYAQDSVGQSINHIGYRVDRIIPDQPSDITMRAMLPLRNIMAWTWQLEDIVVQLSFIKSGL